MKTTPFDFRLTKELFLEFDDTNIELNKMVDEVHNLRLQLHGLHFIQTSENYKKLNSTNNTEIKAKIDKIKEYLLDLEPKIITEFLELFHLEINHTQLQNEIKGKLQTKILSCIGLQKNENSITVYFNYNKEFNHSITINPDEYTMIIS